MFWLTYHMYRKIWKNFLEFSLNFEFLKYLKKHFDFSTFNFLISLFGYMYVCNSQPRKKKKKRLLQVMASSMADSFNQFLNHGYVGIIHDSQRDIRVVLWSYNHGSPRNQAILRFYFYFSYIYIYIYIYIYNLFIYLFINTHTGDSFDLKFSKKSEPWLIYTGNVWQESPHGALVDHLCFFVELISQKNKYIHSKLITILFWSMNIAKPTSPKVNVFFFKF
jgi:hypothetical protein